MHKTIYRAFAIVQKLCKSNIHNNHLLLHACQFHSVFCILRVIHISMIPISSIYSVNSIFHNSRDTFILSSNLALEWFLF